MGRPYFTGAPKRQTLTARTTTKTKKRTKTKIRIRTSKRPRVRSSDADCCASSQRAEFARRCQASDGAGYRENASAAGDREGICAGFYVICVRRVERRSESAPSAARNAGLKCAPRCLSDVRRFGGRNSGRSRAGTAKPDAKAAKDSAAASPQVTFIFIPAISDAGGPDPRPYTYDVKPAEEAIYRNKMLDLAAAQVRGPANAATKDAAATPKKSSVTKSAAKSAGKLPAPVFDDVSLRIFDLSNSNEPVLVLSAKTHPAVVPASATGSVEEPQEITLIARTNLEGELRKLFFSQTDSRHLDVTPRMELIDAVDADGDGRGELLFRRIFDDGSAYAIYRVTADRLWPLFEGSR